MNYVAQLDIVSSGMQVLENDALVSSSGVEALGLMSNRLASIGEKSLVWVFALVHQSNYSPKLYLSHTLAKTFEPHCRKPRAKKSPSFLRYHRFTVAGLIAGPFTLPNPHPTPATTTNPRKLSLSIPGFRFLHTATFPCVYLISFTYFFRFYPIFVLFLVALSCQKNNCLSVQFALPSVCNIRF